MEPKRLTARCAQYIDALTNARACGITWGELAAVLGACSAGAARKAFERAQKGIECGLYRPLQKPLPEPTQTTTTALPASGAATHVREQMAQRPLPGAKKPDEIRAELENNNIQIYE
ncbi:MAG: hypothetical protein ACYCXT_11055 [Acidiferrobacteraceae bacterium]